MAEVQSLKQQYQKTIAPKLQKELKKDNVWSVPRLKMVKLNVGIGPLVTNKKDYSEVVTNLAAITGQKPIVTKARRAISNFKIRENMPVGVTVTLRGKRMYDFVYKLINVTFPRIRDFRGFPMKCLDDKGNVNVGLRENSVFPEVNPDNIEKIHGLQVTIVTTAQNKEDGYGLFKALGFPFQKGKEVTVTATATPAAAEPEETVTETTESAAPTEDSPAN